MIQLKALPQVIRYLLVGTSLNLAWFFVYLILTSKGLSPVATVTICYPVAVYIGYRFHGVHTFKLKGSAAREGALQRYVNLYISGYLVNAIILHTFHTKMGVQHGQVQFLAVIACSAFLYSGMKLYVFRETQDTDAEIKLLAISKIDDKTD